jgi:hypothetical protein
MAEYGGYMKKIQIDYLRKVRDDQNENRKLLNDVRLIRATWTAGIAGFLLFLMEIVKFFFRH